MPNRLAAETSPYLLQHKDNPVNWHAWGPEALGRAKAEEKPIFLSIGYSACHWCHVMEHESFENPRIARLLNESYVSIKVDREERPDLDQIYMNAVQMMTGRGGWPMSVFLTPDLQPFYGGTYWPETSRGGMPGFDQILQAVAAAWRDRRPELTTQAAELTKHLTTTQIPAPSDGSLSEQLLHSAATGLSRSFDPHHGGFGGAPKFPHPMDLRLLLRVWRRESPSPRMGEGRGEGLQRSDSTLRIVTATLDKMAAGGIYDHLGGGFHRYSVDERWLVPHFEKMLYDNALLAGAYTDAFLATQNADYARVARETLDYLLRDMTDPAGGIYSTEDADSEGEEGKFYIWTPAEVEAMLGPEAAETFCYVYDVSEAGNFERSNILNLPKTIEQCAKLRRLDPERLRADLATWRAKLLDARDKRVRPGRDDKVIVSWNGLAIDTLAQAAGALDEPRYLAAAKKAADFILAKMRRADGRLLHVWRGEAKLDAYLDDYACLANGLISLYEAGFDERYIEEAVHLADIMLAHFADRDGGGFFFTADDHEALVARQKDWQDSSTPSGNAMAATALLRLGKLTGRRDYLDAAFGTLQAAAGLMERFPSAAGQMLAALDFQLGPTPEIVILGGDDPDTTAALSDLRHRYVPNKVVGFRKSSDESTQTSPLAPLFSGKTPLTPPPTVFICENFTCQAPSGGMQAVTEAWGRL
jgi:uncharacterized protein YyaL (SSP411 family)